MNEWLTVQVDSLDGSITLTTKNGRREVFVDTFDAVSSVEEWILHGGDDIPEGVKQFHGRERWLTLREGAFLFSSCLRRVEADGWVVAGCVRARIMQASS